MGHTSSKRFMGQTYLQVSKIMIPHLSDHFEYENYVYFELDGSPFHFQINVRFHILSDIDRMKRKCSIEFPTLIFQLKLPRLLPLGNFREHGAHHKIQTQEELRDKI